MTDDIPGQWAATPPLVPEPKTTLEFKDIAPAQGDSNDVKVAYKWAQLYSKDIEFEPFFEWIGRRSNPERTDFHDILGSLPMHWGPEDLPPPLRRYFLGRFGK